MDYYVYILKCVDDSFYVGVTNNLEGRVIEHNESEERNSYTFSRRPLKLVFYEIFKSPLEAIEREKQIKGWSRVKKIALIEGNWDKLVMFSKSK